MGLLSSKSAYARNAIEEEDELASSLRKRGKRIISLNRGDPTVYIPTPRHIANAYVSAIRSGKTSYSMAEGIPELREAISSRYKRIYNIAVSPENVVVTAGVSEALSFLNGTLINPEDSAIIFKPYYPPYLSNLLLNLGNPFFAPYEERLDWGIDVDALSRKLKRLQKSKRPKYLIITNPNNPTGTVLNQKVLKELAELANNYGIFLIADEIYDEIVYNGAKFTSMAKICKGIPHAILNGMSKSYDATGFRVGYALFPEHDKISLAIAEKLKDFARVRVSSNTPAQYAFAAALNAHAEHAKEVRKLVSEISGRVNHMVDKLEKNQNISLTRPNGAYYIFARIRRGALKFRSDKEFTEELLKREGIQIAPGYGFGMPGHFRIAALAPKGILGYAADKINDFCEANTR